MVTDATLLIAANNQCGKVKSAFVTLYPNANASVSHRLSLPTSCPVLHPPSQPFVASAPTTFSATLCSATPPAPSSSFFFPSPHFCAPPSPLLLPPSLTPSPPPSSYSSNDGAVDLSVPPSSAPPSSAPTSKSKMEEVVVKKAVDVAVANPDATKKIAVAAIGASDI